MKEIGAVTIGNLIKAHYEKDEHKFKTYAEFIAEAYKEKGEERAERIIRSKIDGSYKNKPVAVILDEKEEKIMFHTLGYDYQPRWNDTKGGYRNWFDIYPSEDNGDYIAIKSLVEKGFMQKDGMTAWNEEVYSVTNKGNAYVVDLWFKKKKESKPSRSKRRYQARSCLALQKSQDKAVLNYMREQLTKAKELMQKLIDNAPDTYSGTNIELQQKKMFSFKDAVNKAEQFLKDSEVSEW